MKKICRTIKARKFKANMDDTTLAELQGNDFVVLFKNDTYVKCLGKDELRYLLEKDHINPIRYIFDLTDRIILDRDVLINTDEV